MKNINLKNYLVVLLLAIVGVLSIINWSTYNKLGNALDETKDYKFKYSLMADSLGRQHALYEIQQHHLSELNADDKKLVEDVAKSLGKSQSDIKSITKISTSTTAPFHIKFDNPTFNDGHLSVKLDKYGDGTYIYKDTCWLTTTSEPKRFLGIKYKEVTKGDIHFGNPNTKIDGLQNISIDKLVRPKHWVIGPFVGVDYKLQPTIGLALTYKLLAW